jgi:hypothetical protein
MRHEAIFGDGTGVVSLELARRCLDKKAWGKNPDHKKLLGGHLSVLSCFGGKKGYGFDGIDHESR